MKKILKPESLMMTHGYRPELSEGALKTPLFQTSTFAFRTAEEGKSFFELTYGLRQKENKENLGLVYSRINNPNLEILENRLCLWDKAEDCAIFESGMSAISTVLLEYLKPGDLLLFSSPVYGGTDHFISNVLKGMGIESICLVPSQTKKDIISMIEKAGLGSQLSFIYIETPCNPTNDLIDIQMCREIADYFSYPDKQISVAVDNTYMGPLWSHPLEHGADLVIYSATKYIGGHSDLIAGAVLGKFDVIKRVKTLRTFLGNMPSPHTCWLLLRSLETLKIRMEQQARNAEFIASYLEKHPRIKKVMYLGNLSKGSRSYEIFERQYSSSGAMISFMIEGGEPEAFRFLNNLKLIKLAVSLGSTESLIQHPYTMTHAGIDPKQKSTLGITDNLVRLSVGVENYEDLIWDIANAFTIAYSPNIEASALHEMIHI